MPVAGKRGPAWDALALLVGLTIVGLALRLPMFGDSLFADELSTNYVVHGFGVGNVFNIVASDQEGTPPLFFVLTWLTSAFGGNEGLRLVSLLAGLAAIPLTYLLGVRTVGRRAASAGAVLMTLSPFQIYYSTEARAYALVMLCCLLAALFLVIALDSGRTRWWVAYGLSAAAAIYTHYTAIFVLIGLFGWAFVARPGARRQLLLATLTAALLFVPWIPQFLADTDAPASQAIEVLHPLTLSTFKTDLLTWSFGNPLVLPGQLPGDLAWWLIGSGLALGAVGLLVRLRSEGLQWPPAGVILVLILAAAVPLGAVVHQFFASSVFIPRNLISSSPGLALALGALVTSGRASFRYAAVGLLVAGTTIGALKMLDDQNQRPDFGSAAEFIERSGPPNAPVVGGQDFTPGPQTALQAALAPEGEPFPPDRSVLTLNFPTIEELLNARRENLPILKRLPIPSEQEIAGRAARMAGSGTLFLVTYGRATLQQQRDFPGTVASFLAALPPRFQEVDSRSFPGGGIFPVTVYVMRGDRLSRPG
jgi:hypothetical protein